MQSSPQVCPGLAERRFTNPPNDLRVAASPAGGWVALLTGNATQADNPYIYSDMRLELVHLPDCRRRVVSDLLSAPIQAQLTDSGASPPPAVFAVRSNLPARWSPDGSALAFVAALEGDTADLYSYDVRNAALRRLSSGPAHVLGFWWSPDSHWLVYQLGMPSRPHYDPSLASVQVAAADGSVRRQLYSAPVGSLGESFDGWLSSSTFVVHGVDSAKRFSLRSVDLNTAQVVTLGLQYTESVAADPRSHTLAFVVRDGPGNTLAAGAYLLQAMTVVPAYAHAAQSVVWCAATNRYLVETKSDGVLALSPQLEQTFFRGEITGYGHAFAAAPDGSALVFFAGGDPAARASLRLYSPDGKRQRDISTATPVRQAIFSPDGRALAYTLDEADASYYLLRLDEPAPTRVALPAHVDSIGWAHGE